MARGIAKLFGFELPAVTRYSQHRPRSRGSQSVTIRISSASKPSPLRAASARDVLSRRELCHTGIACQVCLCRAGSEAPSLHGSPSCEVETSCVPSCSQENLSMTEFIGALTPRAWAHIMRRTPLHRSPGRSVQCTILPSLVDQPVGNRRLSGTVDGLQPLHTAS